MPWAFDDSNNFASTGLIVVQIGTTATLTGLSIEPASFHLDRFGPTESLIVTGHYSDDIDRDLTLGTLGTIYEVADTGVATVSADGLVTSVGFGQTTVTATHGAFSAQAQIEVVGLPCPADITHDDAVNVDDLIAVILSWGPCYACAADIDGNGAVDVDDMVAVITAWGPCPAPPMDVAPPGPPPNYGCLDAIKWEQYLQVLESGTPEEVACWNCWAYWHLCVCAGQCAGTPPDCPCPDPFEM